MDEKLIETEELVKTLEGWLDDPLVIKALVMLGGLVLIVIVVRLLQGTVSRYVRDNTTRYQVRKVLTFFGYVAAAFFIALVFSEQLGGMAVALGVAGAGAAFALQEVIASVAGWMAVSFGSYYRVGDRVQLGGIKGDVIDIGILRTTIMQIGDWISSDSYNGRIVRVANSFVFKEPVFNYSGEFPFLWDEIMIPIKYGSDYRLARDMIQRVAGEVVGEYAKSAEQAWKPITRRYLVEPASVRPLVTLSANHNWIEFTLRYVVDYKARRPTKDQLFTRLLEEIDKVPDQVGIAASTLNIEKVPPIDVHVTRE